MKIKYNIPMINNIKEKINKYKNNIKINMDSKNKEKIPIKHYTLLVLMLLLGIVTLSKNIKQFNSSRKEKYTEYNLNDKKEDGNENILASSKQTYITAESSIFTNEENIVQQDDKSIQTMSTNNSNLIMPVEGKIIKEYAMEKLIYSETLGMWRTHPGIDIACEIGTNVVSVSNGEIKNVGYDDFYGNFVIIQNGIYTYKYCNLDEGIIVKKGDAVKKNDVIGIIGVSAKGEIQDKSHLHFEVLKDNININPLDLMNFSE